MALKELIVYVDQTEGALSRARLAADLARRHESRLVALFVREFSQAQLDLLNDAELGLASGKDLDKVKSNGVSGHRPTRRPTGCDRCSRR